MKYVAYYRVSTQKQGKSGLGRDAQEKMVNDFVKANGGEIVGVYEEVESGKNDNRPKLAEAMKHAALVGGRILVGKLDRLSRDLNFITNLQKNRVDFVVSDMPHCDSFTIHIYGALAQREREMISSRTKQGLAAAKARGVKLGTNNLNMDTVQEASAKGVQVRQQNADDFAARVRPTIEALTAKGMSLRAVAAELEALGAKTARGGSKWTAMAVRNAMKRAAE